MKKRKTYRLLMDGKPFPLAYGMGREFSRGVMFMAKSLYGGERSFILQDETDDSVIDSHNTGRTPGVR